MSTSNQPQDELRFSTERPMSPAEAEQFCFAVCDTMKELLSVIEEETDLVRAGRLMEAGHLQPQKARLVHEYTQGVNYAKQYAVALGNLAPAAVHQMRHQHREFQPVLRINLAVLSTAREVTNNILSTVAQSVGAAQRTTTYGPKGTQGQKTHSAEGIALNRSL